VDLIELLCFVMVNLAQLSFSMRVVVCVFLALMFRVVMNLVEL
jgi:hypothetical protein